MQENTGRGRGQQHVDQHHALVGSGLRNQRLGRETRSQREAGYRQRADDAADGRQRHGAKQPAEIGALAFAGAVDDHAGAHEQQRLVDDVRERVRRGAVQRHLRADADRADHEADLVDDRVGENAARVVFEQRVDNAVHDHVEADPDQYRLAGEQQDQRQYRGLGGECRQEHRAGRTRFRVGVGEPGRQRRRRGVDQDADQDHPGIEIGRQHRLDVDRTGVHDDTLDTDLQNDAAQQVHDRVANAGGARGRRAAAPDDHGRKQRHQLPEQEQRDQVAGEAYADGAGGIGMAGGQFVPLRLAERKKPADEGHQRKNRREQAPQRTAFDRLDDVIEERHRQDDAVGYLPHRPQRRQRRAEHRGRPPMTAQRADQHRGGEQNQRGRQKFSHPRPPRGNNPRRV